MNTYTFAACIFDFDGVIIDSEPLHAEAKRNTLEHFSIPYPADLFDRFKGRTDRAFFDYVAGQLAHGQTDSLELEAYKRQDYLRLFEDVPLVPGVQAFLRAARSRYKKIGLATSATGRDFSLAAQKYGLEDWFDVIVTGADTSEHKPHPEPYLKAIAGLQVAASQTLAIEDSPNGIQSAKAAGCTVAALTTSFGAAELSAAGAELLADSFDSLAHMLGILA